MIKISQALSLLLNSISDSIIVNSKKRLDNIHIEAQLNWNKIYEIAGYHGLRPILFEAFKNINIPIYDKLEAYARDNVVSNMVSGKEFVRVINLCTLNNINVIPYKGHSLLATIYQHKQLREIGDLDFLFHPTDARKGLELLVNDGYVINPNDEFNIVEKNIPIDNVFKAYGAYEATLAKSVNGKLGMIDFHWGFHYSFLPYKIDIDSLFENKSTIKVNNVDCVAPSDETLFIMMIIHHGGRDCWIKLKLMVDLLAFMETKGNSINWSKMLVSMTEMKLKRPMLVGYFLLMHYFEYKIPKVIEAEFEKENINFKLIKPIIDYWENCYNILSMKGRLKYERILLSIQDTGFSKNTYFKEIFKMYSIPNPIESPRLVTFPDNYYFLNAVSKVVTYIYKRGFGKVKR
jgi:Uncharacterised nucleotidyltransferase